MSAHRPVPLGCRRAGHFLLKESGQRNVPLRSRPLRGFAAACGARRSPSLACGARAHPMRSPCGLIPSASAAPKGVKSRRANARPRARKIKSGYVATIRPWSGISGPAFHGRAFTGWRPFTPRGGAAPAERSAGGREGSRLCRAGARMHRRGTGRRRTHPPGQRPKGAARGTPFFGSFLWQRKERDPLGGSRAEPDDVPQPRPQSGSSLGSR